MFHQLHHVSSKASHKLEFTFQTEMKHFEYTFQIDTRSKTELLKGFLLIKISVRILPSNAEVLQHAYYHTINNRKLVREVTIGLNKYVLNVKHPKQR